MKFKAVSVVTLLWMASLKVMAAADQGKIVEVYTHPSGPLGFKLDNGFPNANIENNCNGDESYNNEWAGVGVAADSVIKSAILAAKATQDTVVVVTLGNCEGNWLKVEAMHIK